jgi:TatD DNase family protein
MNNLNTNSYFDAHAYHIDRGTEDVFQVMVGLDTWGIHPWDLHAPFDRAKFDQVFSQRQIDLERVIAVGECGLDRVHEGIASMEDQIYVLKKQLELSHYLKKPTIIHSVRAYSDLLGILKKCKPQENLLLHAYGGNEYEMNELLKYPSYFSFGARLVHNTIMIKKVPLDRLLLETGDQTEVTIIKIYELAAIALDISVENLQETICKNFLRFYGLNNFNEPSTSDFLKKLHRRLRT